jgi:hypothetical protein
VAAAAARRRRWLVTWAPVVAAGASSRVGPREWHGDAKDDADKNTRNELPPTEVAHAAHLLSAVCAEASARKGGRRNGTPEVTTLPPQRLAVLPESPALRGRRGSPPPRTC